jgi:archaeal flagellar protein FlaJ
VVATADADVAGAPARAIRVKRGGAQPARSTLTGFDRWAWRTFGRRAASRPPDPTLEENLIKAHMRVRGDEYVAKVLASTVVVGIVAGAAAIGVGLFLYFVHQPLLALAAGALLAVLGPVGTYGVMLAMPGTTAKDRGRKIDRKLSAAMSFVSAMSSADVNVDQIFRELGRQKIYGEVAEEAAWITRDTELLGVDILTSIRRGARQSPSKRFQDFLQGVVTTATSGGQLKPYFLLKAEQYERENKLDALQRVETMGLMAETFVTVVVAFPLFLVIIIAIFAIIGGGGSFMLTILWVIIGLMIPMMQGVFIFGMYALAQEG